MAILWRAPGGSLLPFVFRAAGMDHVMSDEILTPRQLAEELQLGKSTVYRALEDGRLPGEKICGRWRTLHSQLIELVRDDRVPATRSNANRTPPSDGRRGGRFRGKVAQPQAKGAS